MSTCAQMAYVTGLQEQPYYSVHSTLRGMNVSRERCVMLPFTRRSCVQFPICMQLRTMDIVKQHQFLGVTIDSGLTWPHQISNVIFRTDTDCNVLRVLAGKRRGSSCPAFLRLDTSLVRQALPSSVSLADKGIRA